MKKQILSVLFAIVITATVASAQTVPQLRADNIDKVIAAMTLEEKAQLLVGGSAIKRITNSDFIAPRQFVNGVAGITAPIPRLGIPATLLSDGPAGIRISSQRPNTDKTFYATCFPMSTLMAATWDMPLVERVAAALGNEVLEYGSDIQLAPGLNLHRNSLCGRLFEYYSEDPLLSGKAAAAYIRGVQSNGVGTSAKHFAVNSQEENRTQVDERVSQRALREIYLRNFEYAIREGKPWTVMSSYNAVNDTLAQESHDLLTAVLRNDWGYEGMVMSDWIGRRNTIAQVHAGNDLLEPGEQVQVNDIVEAVKNGKLSIKDVDRNVKRILQMVVKTPRFRKYNYSEAPDLKTHALLTRQAATEGMVLLKNHNNTLPLSTANNGKVALFGVNAYDMIMGGDGSGVVYTSYQVNLDEGLKNAGFQLNDDLSELYTSYVNFLNKQYKDYSLAVRYIDEEINGNLPGVEITKKRLDKVVKETDIAIITIGRQSTEGMDRRANTGFNLTDKEQRQLTSIAEAFHKEGKKVVVVLNVCGAIETASWRDKADAILVAWLPGLEAGNSVADVLTGKVNPSGRLSKTWEMNYSDDPASRNFPQREYNSTQDKKALAEGKPVKDIHYTNYEEDIYVGYRYYDTFGKPVSYPFGYGLSYTTFQFSQLTAKAKGKTVEVSVTVKNTGNTPGKQVAQIYVTAPDGKLPHPAKELKAFAKTRELKPGEQQTLTMTIPVRELASFDTDNSQWLTEAGVYTFQVAENVSDVKATATCKVPKYTEKVSDVLKPHHNINVMKK